MAGSEAQAATIRWGRVFGGAIATLLVLEVVCQAGIYSFAGRPFRSVAPYLWSPYGLVRNNPQLTSPNFRINRNGFRDVRDFDRQKGANTFRVILLGGSVLYSGLGGGVIAEDQRRVGSDQTIAQYLTSILRRDPDFAGAQIEVINAAVNFNRIVEVSSAYLEEYIHWRPDAIVVFGAVNNFSEPRLRGDFERMRTSLQKPHPWRPEFDRMNNETSLSATLERVWRNAAGRSAAVAVSNKIAVMLAARATLDSERFRLGTQLRAEPELETPEEREAYFKVFASYAEAIRGAARSADQAVAFAWEPRLADVEGIKPMSPAEQAMLPVYRQPPQVAEQYEQSRKLFLKFFAEESVPVVDPTEPLRGHRDTVYIDYGHYTPDGNRFVAAVVHDQLKPMLLEQYRKRFGHR